MNSIQAGERLRPGRVVFPLGCAFARRRAVPPDPTLDELYRRERASLLRYLRKHGGGDETEDLLQDVFVRAAASNHLVELRNPGGYLCRIAQTVLIDRARKRSCRIRCLPIENACDPSCNPGQEEDLLARALEDELQRALRALPRKTRSVFMLNRFDHLSYRQIHERLGISEATVAYHMGKALEHLRTILRES